MRKVEALAEWNSQALQVTATVASRKPAPGPLWAVLQRCCRLGQFTHDVAAE